MLTLVLLAAAMGLVFMPIVISIANPSPASVGALSGGYVTVITVLAPLVARRQRGSNGNGSGDNRD